MDNRWTIDLSVSRRLRQKYIEMGDFVSAREVNHTSSPNEGKTIGLLTLAELKALRETNPDEVLIDIFGDESFAKDCDEDTRFGFVAYGKIIL